MTSSTDISNVASLELGHFEDLTNLQKEMYLTDSLYNSLINGSEYNSQKDNEEIESKFYKKIKKRNMSVDILEKMPVSPGSSGEFIFEYNNKMDFVAYTYMYRKFPRLKVKDELKDNVQICWTHNLGHNCIESLELIIDDNPKQTLTNTWLDIYSQFFMKNGFRKKYRMDIGDRKYLKDWSTELDPISVKVPLPFFYDRRSTANFPLFLASMSKLKIRGRFRMKISQLLKMRVRKSDKDEWTETEFKWQSLQGVNNEDQEIPGLPELYTNYQKITQEEKDFWNDEINHNHNKVYKMLYDDIIIINPDKLYNSKEPFSELLSSKTTAKVVYWVAQNQNGLKYNNYSNYTTNALDMDKGDYPITKISAKHGGITNRFQGLDYSHFDSIMSYYRHISSPFEKGYGSWCLCGDTYSNDADVGPILDLTKTSLTLSLEESGDKSGGIIEIKKDNLLESILDKSRDSKVSDNRYKIYIFIQVIKKMEFNHAEKVKVYDGNEKIKPN